jgi:hypothetical protein
MNMSEDLPRTDEVGQIVMSRRKGLPFLLGGFGCRTASAASVPLGEMEAAVEKVPAQVGFHLLATVADDRDSGHDYFLPGNASGANLSVRPARVGWCQL